MNIDAISHYLATQFSTHVRTYDTEGRFLKLETKRIDLDDDFFHSPEMEGALLALANEHAPAIVCVNDYIFYGTVKSPENTFIVGPVSLVHGLELKYHLQHESSALSIADQLFTHAMDDFINALLLLHNVYRDEILTMSQCLAKNCLEEKYQTAIQTETSSRIFTNREYSTKHNPYSQEQREMLAIETGNLELLAKSKEELYAGSLGITAKDPNRNGKNLAIIVVALATRAAIRGGLMPEAAFTLGDTYMQEIEEVKNVFNIGILTKNAEQTLATMVRDLKRSQSAPSDQVAGTNPLIGQCKDYVFSHLHSRLTIQDIADHFYVHPNYLTSLFRKETGMSLYQYILSEKMSLAENLLIYSNYSLIEISSYLGFSSQSHLGKLFKKTIGMTPQQYRNTYQKRDEWEVLP
jgi:AraC-like DNA-binding protein